MASTAAAGFVKDGLNVGLHPNHLGHPALGRKLIPLIKQIGIDLEETK